MNLFLIHNDSTWQACFDCDLGIIYAKVNDQDVPLTPTRERIIYNAFADHFDLDMEMRVRKLDRYINH